MGEVGIERNTFLYDLELWEIRCIVEGYRRRERTLCLLTRWQTFWQISTGMADISKAGIYSPEDLMRFPWEKEDEPIISDEERDRIRAELQELNRKK